MSRLYKSKLFIWGSFVGAAQSPAAPTNQTPFVGAARITSRPCCSICRGGWCLGTRARHCRGGSIIGRPYKKIEPLLKIIFYVVHPYKNVTEISHLLGYLASIHDRIQVVCKKEEKIIDRSIHQRSIEAVQ